MQLRSFFILDSLASTMRSAPLLTHSVQLAARYLGCVKCCRVVCINEHAHPVYPVSSCIRNSRRRNIDLF
jgi:hypothetical protein